MQEAVFRNAEITTQTQETLHFCSYVNDRENCSKIMTAAQTLRIAELRRAMNRLMNQNDLDILPASSNNKTYDSQVHKTLCNTSPLTLSLCQTHEGGISANYPANNRDFNSSNNDTMYDMSNWSWTLSDYITVPTLALCVVIGVSLNMFVLVELVRQYHQRTRIQHLYDLRSAYILQKIHLTVCNLITAGFVCTIKLVWGILYQWYAGDIACAVASFLFMFSSNLMSNIICCIAIGRYRTTSTMLNHNTGCKQTTTGITDMKWTQMALSVGWTLAAVSSIPQLFVFGCFQPIDSDWTQCVSSFFIQEYLDQVKNMSIGGNTTADYDAPIEFFGMTARSYGLMHLIISFYIPFIIIAFCYVRVSIRMSRYTQSRKNETSRPTFNSIDLETNTLIQSKEKDAKFRSLTSIGKNSQIVVHIRAERAQLPSIKIDNQQVTKLHRKQLIDQQHEPSSAPNGFVQEQTKENDIDVDTNFRKRSTSAPVKKCPTIVLAQTEKSIIEPHVNRRLNRSASNWHRTARKRMTRTGGMIIGIFLLFWVPYNVCSTLASMNDAWNQFVNEEIYFCFVFIYFVVIANPLIYGCRL